MPRKIVRFETWRPDGLDNEGFLVAGDVTLAALGCTAPADVVVDNSGNIFVSDSSEHIIVRLDKSGNAEVYAGSPGVNGRNGDSVVSASAARFNRPSGLTVDRRGNLYVADTNNNQIRKIDTMRRVSLIAGDPDGSSGYAGGSYSDARFNRPLDVAVDASDNVFVSDTGNHAVRLIRGSNVYTVAGNGTAGDALGYGTASRLDTPNGIAVDKGGRVFVNDTGNYKVKVIYNNFLVQRYCGSGVVGFKMGSASETMFQELKFIGVDLSGNVYVAVQDPPPSFQGRIVRIDLNGQSGTVAAFDVADSPYLSGLAVEPSGTIYLTMREDELVSSSSTASSASSVSSAGSSASSVSSSLSSGGSSASSESSASSSQTESTSSSWSSESSSGCYVTLLQLQETVLVPETCIYYIDYDGDDNTYGVVTINGVQFKAGYKDGAFTWDIDTAREYAFSTPGESITRDADGVEFTVAWAGGDLPRAGARGFVSSFVVGWTFGSASSSTSSVSSASTQWKESSRSESSKSEDSLTVGKSSMSSSSQSTKAIKSSSSTQRFSTSSESSSSTVALTTSSTQILTSSSSSASSLGWSSSSTLRLADQTTMTDSSKSEITNESASSSELLTTSSTVGMTTSSSQSSESSSTAAKSSSVSSLSSIGGRSSLSSQSTAAKSSSASSLSSSAGFSASSASSASSGLSDASSSSSLSSGLSDASSVSSFTLSFSSSSGLSGVSSLSSGGSSASSGYSVAPGSSSSNSSSQTGAAIGEMTIGTDFIVR